MKNSVVLGKYNLSVVQEKYGVNKCCLIKIILRLVIHLVIPGLQKPKNKVFFYDYVSVQHLAAMKTLSLVLYKLKNAITEFTPVNM